MDSDKAGQEEAASPKGVTTSGAMQAGNTVVSEESTSCFRA